MKRQKSSGSTWASKNKTTYMLMAHEEPKIVRQHLGFKERDHVLPDGTRRDQNCGASTCASKNETRYSLMAHKETTIVRQHLGFKEQDHILLDGT